MKRLHVRVNGADEAVLAPTHWTLLQLLREGLGLLGTEEGCGEGSCGSCSVVVDGTMVRACLYLAVRCDGRDITTVEGLADGDRLHPLQDAFARCGAVQCGFCTPGFLLVARQLLAENPNPSDEEIREYLAGNLCRCGSYEQIVTAVRAVAGADG